MEKIEIDTTHRKAVIYCTNIQGLPYALFSAAQAAQLSPDRDFDILVCGPEPFEIPQYFLDLGIIPVVIDLAEVLLSHGFNTARLPIEVYFWMWMPKYIGHIYDRILKLDIDTYILSHELSRFMDFDLGPHAIGAVRDILQWVGQGRPVSEFKARELGGKKYLNAGILLVDSQRYNDTGFLDKILKVQKEDGPFIQHDQSLINLALQGEWAELSPVWNWQWGKRFPSYRDYVGAQIVHFLGIHKPWCNDVKQTKHSRVLVNQYYVFMKTHFPDQAFDVEAVATYRRTIWETFLDIWNHVEKLPRLYLLMRKFKKDDDIFY